MIGFPRIALACELLLAIVLAITWLILISKPLIAQYWRKTHTHAACYVDETDRLIGILQQLQRLASNDPNTSLADIINQIQRLQEMHGDDASLEVVMQRLIGNRLYQQCQLRAGLRKARVAA